MYLETIIWRSRAFVRELGYKVQLFDEQKQTQGEGHLPQPTVGSLEQKPGPPIRRSQLPLKFHDQNRQNTKEKPTEERKCFPTKAISSNLYFSNKFVSSFRCHYSKMTCCLSAIIEPLSFFSNMLVNIYQYSLALSLLFLTLLQCALSPCQYFSSLDYCYVFHVGRCVFSCGLWGAINIYNWTVNTDK